MLKHIKGSLLYFFLFLILSGTFLPAQNRGADSLKTLLLLNKYSPGKTDIIIPDTASPVYLNKLSEAWYIEGNYDSALYYAQAALTFAKKVAASRVPEIMRAGKKWEAKSYNSLGFILYNQGEFPKAIANYDEALKINEALNEKKAMSINLGNKGTVYEEQGEYLKAIDCYFRTLKIDEALGNKREIGRDYGNIGNVYANQGDYAKTLDYYFKSLKIDETFSKSKNNEEALQGKRGVAASLCNIGNVYLMQGDNTRAMAHLFKALTLAEETNYARLKVNILGNIGSAYFDKQEFNNALNYYFKALKENEAAGNKNGIASTLLNIGNVFHIQAKHSPNRVTRDTLFAKALGYFFKSLKLNEEQGYQPLQATTMGNIGDIFVSQKKYKDAFTYLSKALALSESIGATNDVKERYLELSELYESSDVALQDSLGGKLLNMEQMRLRANYYYKKHIAWRDKLFNEESKKQSVRKQMNYEFEKKEVYNLAIYEKQMAIAAADKKRQTIFIILIAVVAIAVTAIALVIMRSLRIVRKQKVIIERQKEMVEEKQKEMVDSIYYAKRIQQSLLPTEKYIERELNKYN